MFRVFKFLQWTVDKSLNMVSCFIQLEKCHIEEGKTKIVTEGLKSNAGTDTPNAGKAMVDPSSWAHPFELEGRIGVC